jgi:hypothetical protein
VFTATQIVGFVGILHAVKPGAFGWSMDARRKGGSIVANLLESLSNKKVMTPEQTARKVFEKAIDYANAVQQLSTLPIVNPAYFIVSGIMYPQGTVLARSRDGVAHQWDMNDEIPFGKGVEKKRPFWTGITNYDLNMPPPPSDDRQRPLVERMNALEGQDKPPVTTDSVRTILRTFPTQNPHTDIQAIMTPATGGYDCVIMYDHGFPSKL